MSVNISSGNMCKTTNKIWLTTILCLFILSIIPGDAQSQYSSLFDKRSEYMGRLLQISGIAETSSSYMIRPYGADKVLFNNEEDRTLWVSYLDGRYQESQPGFLPETATLFQSFNSTLPNGNNDGAIWQGKGFNVSLTSAWRYKKNIFEVSLNPIMAYSQNLPYDLGPLARSGEMEFSYQYVLIDDVQRFGDSHTAWVNMGDSAVEIAVAGLRTGLSNKRMWVGPSVFNSLNFGYNAGGFLHYHISSDGPISTSIGDFEFNFLYGRLKKSSYFPVTDRRFTGLASITALYSPDFIPGLSIGAVRMFQNRWPASFSDVWNDSKDLFQPFLKENIVSEERPRGTDESNQLATIFLRWFFPDYGFEVYSEYGRNDHNFEANDLRTIPDHHRAYSIGFIKTFQRTPDRLASLNVEITQFDPTRSVEILGGGRVAWQPHGLLLQGMTTNGQILGTSASPGSNLQTVQLNEFSEKQSRGMFISRITHHNGGLIWRLNEIEALNDGSTSFENYIRTEYQAGFSYTRQIWNRVEIASALRMSYTFNQHHIYKNDVMNVQLEIGLKKRFR